MPNENENRDEALENENANNSGDTGHNEQNNNGDQNGSDDMSARIKELEEENKQLKANSRKWENRSKQNKKNAEESQNANKTAEERIAALEAQLAESKARDARLAAAQAVSKETGVSVDAILVMNGDTEEELKESVNAVKAAMPSYPVIDGGDPGLKPTVATAQSIREIKDPVKRVKERAKHRELFK